jgi:hypothetical protein
MSHLYHPEATTAGVLSEQCPDCTSKLLANLDSGHTMSACGYYEAPWTTCQPMSAGT